MGQWRLGMVSCRVWVWERGAVALFPNLNLPPGDCANEGVKAVVAGTAITEQDVDVEMQTQLALYAASGQQMPAQKQATFRREILDQILDQFVIKNGADVAGTPAQLPAAEVSQSVSALLAQFGLDAAGMESALVGSRPRT